MPENNSRLSERSSGLIECESRINGLVALGYDQEKIAEMRKGLVLDFELWKVKIEKASWDAAREAEEEFEKNRSTFDKVTRAMKNKFLDGMAVIIASALETVVNISVNPVVESAVVQRRKVLTLVVAGLVGAGITYKCMHEEGSEDKNSKEVRSK